MNLLTLNRPAAIIACVAMLGCSAPKNIMSTDWQSQPVVVDGKADEWPQPLRYANSETKLNYSVSNDDGKLYFCFITTDRRTRSKILMGGLQIRVDADGKDDMPVTLLYPIPGRVRFPGRSKETDNTNDANNNNAPHFDWQTMMIEANTLEISGLPFAKQTTELPLINKFGLNIATGFGAEDRFVYEGSIPLQDLQLKGKDLDITITIKGLPKGQMQSGGRQGGGAGGGGGMRGGAGGMGGGGMGGGGMHGGRHGGGGGGGRYGGGGGGAQAGQSGGANSYQAMFVDQKIKMSMRLAEK